MQLGNVCGLVDILFGDQLMSAFASPAQAIV